MEKTSASNFNIRLLIISIKIIIIFYVVISLFTCSTFVNARMEQSIEFRGTVTFLPFQYHSNGKFIRETNSSALQAIPAYTI